MPRNRPIATAVADALCTGRNASQKDEDLVFRNQFLSERSKVSTPRPKIQGLRGWQGIGISERFPAGLEEARPEAAQPGGVAFPGFREAFRWILADLNEAAGAADAFACGEASRS
jgi:hypothetical protein